MGVAKYRYRNCWNIFEKVGKQNIGQYLEMGVTLHAEIPTPIPSGTIY